MAELETGGAAVDREVPGRPSLADANRDIARPIETPPWRFWLCLLYTSPSPRD